MLGDNTAGLGTVPQNMELVDKQKAMGPAQAQQDSDTANAPQREGATTAAKEQAKETVTITPSLAKGLGSDQLVGMKMTPEMYGSMAALQGARLYHQDVLAGKIDVEKMKEDAKKAQNEQEQGYKKDLAAQKAKYDKDLADFKSKHPSGGGKGGGTKDLQATKAFLHEAEKRRATVAGMFSDDKAKAEAQKWLDDNADSLKKASDKLKELGDIKQPPASGTAGSDKTIPLSTTLPGLE